MFSNVLLFFSINLNKYSLLIFCTIYFNNYIDNLEKIENLHRILVDNGQIVIKRKDHRITENIPKVPYFIEDGLTRIRTQPFTDYFIHDSNDFENSPLYRKKHIGSSSNA